MFDKHYFLAATLAALLFSAPSVAFADSPPVVTGFNAWTPGGDLWVIEGFVVDEDDSCLVEINGIVYDYDWSDTTGYFQFLYHLPPGSFGTIEATAYDSMFQTGSASTAIAY